MTDQHGATASGDGLGDDYANLPYKDIPKHCVIHGADPDRVANCRIYDGRVVVTGPYDVISGMLGGVKTHEGARMGAYMHAGGDRVITFERLKETFAGPLPRNTAEAISICRFDNIILDAHYTKAPMVSSASIKYPFDWGPMPYTDDLGYLKCIRVPHNGITIGIAQESEKGHLLGYECEELSLVYRIEADPAIDMGKMMRYVWQMNNFLTLFMGWPVYPQRLMMCDATGAQFLYYPGAIFDLKKRIPPTIFTHRIEYDDSIDERFECLLRKWFLLYQRVGRPMSEYFESMRVDNPHRSWFIDNTNTLQRIYKKTDPDMKSLCMHLSDAVKIYRGIYAPDATLITRINATRNHYVHGDPKRPGPMVVTSDLVLARFGNIVAMLIEGKMAKMMACDDPDLLDSILIEIHKKHVTDFNDIPGFIDYDGAEPGEFDDVPAYEPTGSL
ncbi:MAG: hypothetical protein MPK62_02410 [Alphaproteobacteria bacterium]|nr:hypothetical protein [Alphaproteobacteria bacterium]